MKIRNLIVVSDLHCGCRLGLCPPDGVDLDDGGRYEPSEFQRGLWAWWREFWDSWVPQATRNEPFAVVVNGDAVEGVHHGSTYQISQNMGDQCAVLMAVLQPIYERCDGRLYMVRGTEAHVGKSAVTEEGIAKAVGAVPNRLGQHARWNLRMRVGDALVDLLHHIGTTSSSAHEASAVNAELTSCYNEACRWGGSRPDYVVRSHRHRFINVTVANDGGQGQSIVTPGWQGKTPFAWKIAGARLSPPQFGGILIRQGDEEHFSRAYVRHLAAEPEESPNVDDIETPTTGKASDRGQPDRRNRKAGGRVPRRAGA